MAHLKPKNYRTPDSTDTVWLTAQRLGRNYLWIKEDIKLKIFLKEDEKQEDGSVKQKTRPLTMYQTLLHFKYLPSGTVFSFKKYYAKGKFRWADSRDNIAKRFKEDGINWIAKEIGRMGQMTEQQAKDWLTNDVMVGLLE